MSDVLEAIDELIATEKCPHCDRDWHRSALTERIDRMFRSGKIDPNYFAGSDTSPVLCDGSEFIGPLRPEPAVPTFAAGGVYLGSYTQTVNVWDDSWKFLGSMSGGFSISGSSSAYTVQALNSLKAGWGGATYTYMLGVDESKPWIFPQWQWSEPAPVCTEPEIETVDLGVDVEFGPQNWHYEFQRPPQKKSSVTHWAWSPHTHTAKRVHDAWDEFTAIPTPTPRKYDFSSLTPSELTNTGPKQDRITKGRNK